MNLKIIVLTPMIFILSGCNVLLPSCDDAQITQRVIEIVNSNNPFIQANAVTEIVEMDSINSNSIRCAATLSFTNKFLKTDSSARILYVVSDTTDGDKYIEVYEAP